MSAHILYRPSFVNVNVILMTAIHKVTPWVPMKCFDLDMRRLSNSTHLKVKACGSRHISSVTSPCDSFVTLTKEGLY